MKSKYIKCAGIGRWLIWSGFATLLLIAPHVFSSSASLSLLCQMGSTIIFALSYNMLLGQGGMLSFGHAVYSGLGAFCAIHVINLAAADSLQIPLTLMPLVGGLAGMFFGALFGYLTTKKSGTVFAMITLGIAELVYACSLMFPAFFGGEGGISTNRVIGEAFLGVSYGPQIEVYYLIAFWLFVSTLAMYAFTKTPLGRVLNAVRDNPERTAFIGYNPQWVRYLTLLLSAFFAGIAGGLGAINFEIASAENVSALRSGAILLFTFIGGTGYFFGPIIGAVIGVLMTVMLSGFTNAWQLYLGVLFILVVMFAPGGMAGLCMQFVRLLKHGRIVSLAPQLLLLVCAILLMLAGFVLLVEMAYQLRLKVGGGSLMQFAGFAIDATSARLWLLGLALIGAGAVGWMAIRKKFLWAWQTANVEIDDVMRQIAQKVSA